MEDAEPSPSALSAAALSLYAQDRFFEAVAACEEADKAAAEADQDPDPTLGHIRQCKREIGHLVHEMDGDHWILNGESSGVKTSYYRPEGSPRMLFKVDGEVDASLHNIIAMIYECDLFSTWMPGCESSEKVATLSPFRMLLHAVFQAPWPIAWRDVALIGYGDVWDGRDVAIFCRTAQASDGVNIPEPDPAHVRADINTGGFLLTPLKANLTRVRLVIDVDIKLAIVPQWLINQMCKNTLGYIVVLLRKRSKTLDPEYENRITMKREIYGEIERRLDVLDLQHGS